MRIRKKRYHPSTIASISSDGSSTASGFILAAPGVKGLWGGEQTGGVPGSGVSLRSSSNSESESAVSTIG